MSMFMFPVQFEDPAESSPPRHIGGDIGILEVIKVESNGQLHYLRFSFLLSVCIYLTGFTLPTAQPGENVYQAVAVEEQEVPDDGS